MSSQTNLTCRLRSRQSATTGEATEADVRHYLIQLNNFCETDQQLKDAGFEVFDLLERCIRRCMYTTTDWPIVQAILSCDLFKRFEENQIHHAGQVPSDFRIGQTYVFVVNDCDRNRIYEVYMGKCTRVVVHEDECVTGYEPEVHFTDTYRLNREQTGNSTQMHLFSYTMILGVRNDTADHNGSLWRSASPNYRDGGDLLGDELMMVFQLHSRACSRC